MQTHLDQHSSNPQEFLAQIGDQPVTAELLRKITEECCDIINDRIALTATSANDLKEALELLGVIATSFERYPYCDRIAGNLHLRTLKPVACDLALTGRELGWTELALGALDAEIRVSRAIGEKPGKPSEDSQNQPQDNSLNLASLTLGKST